MILADLQGGHEGDMRGNYFQATLASPAGNFVYCRLSGSGCVTFRRTPLTLAHNLSAPRPEGIIALDCVVNGSVSCILTPLPPRRPPPQPASCPHSRTLLLPKVHSNVSSFLAETHSPTPYLPALFPGGSSTATPPPLTSPAWNYMNFEE